MLKWAITRRLSRLHTKQLLIWQKTLGIMTHFQALLPSHPQEHSGGLKDLIYRPPQTGSLRKEHAFYNIQEQWPLEKVSVGCWVFQINHGATDPSELTMHSQQTSHTSHIFQCQLWTVSPSLGIKHVKLTFGAFRWWY